MLCLKAEGFNQKVRDLEQGLVRVLPQTKTVTGVESRPNPSGYICGTW